MTRLLFWIALAVLVVAALRSKLRQGAAKNSAPSGAGPRPERAPETMCCCAHCGVYFPASEAVSNRGLDYCSAGHVGLPAK